MGGNMNLIKNEENLKTVVVEHQDDDKLIDYLEQHEISIFYCRICDLMIPDGSQIESHYTSKSHKKTRDDL